MLKPVPEHMRVLTQFHNSFTCWRRMSSRAQFAFITATFCGNCTGNGSPWSCRSYPSIEIPQDCNVRRAPRATIFSGKSCCFGSAVLHRHPSRGGVPHLMDRYFFCSECVHCTNRLRCCVRMTFQIGCIEGCLC